MDCSGWVLQVYEMSDVDTQRAAAELLSGNSALVADMRTCERGAFLTVELAEPAEALSVYEMVMMVDPNAELIHTTSSPSDARDDVMPV